MPSLIASYRNQTTLYCQLIHLKWDNRKCNQAGQKDVKSMTQMIGQHEDSMNRERKEPWEKLDGTQGDTETLSQKKEFQLQLSNHFVNDGFVDGRPFTQRGGCIHAAGIQSHRLGGPSAAQLFNLAVVSCNWCHVCPSLHEQWASWALTATQWHGWPKAIVDKWSGFCNLSGQNRRALIVAENMGIKVDNNMEMSRGST